MSYLDRVSAISIYEISTLSMTPFASYSLVDSLPEACFLIRILNSSDVTILLSLDNHYMHDVIQGGEDLVVEAQRNSDPTNKKAKFRKGQPFYVIAAGLSKGGKILLTAYY